MRRTSPPCRRRPRTARPRRPRCPHGRRGRRARRSARTRRARHDCTASGSRSRRVRSAPTSQSARAPSRDELRHARRATQDPQAAGAVPKAGEQPHRLGRPGRVDQVAARPHDDVIAAKGGRDLVRRRGAAGEAQQRRVVNVAPSGFGEPRPPRELACKQAGPHRLARRVPASQVARHRQRRHDPTDAGRLAHERDSIADRQSPCAGAFAAGATPPPNAPPALLIRSFPNRSENPHRNAAVK